MLLETAMAASDLADRNYWAYNGEEPKRYADGQGFNRFLQDQLGIDPESYDPDTGIERAKATINDISTHSK